MSRKWLEKEGKSWVDDGLIEESQYKAILARYPAGHQKSLLPIFASILIGLSILTFVASNWQGIPQLARVLLICVVVIGFYIAGDQYLKEGKRRLGISMVTIGLIGFGAGIFLLGQMYHFVSYNATPFILWALAALMMTALIESRFIYFFTTLIIMVGQVYSVLNFGTFSFILAALLVFGVSHFTYHRPNHEAGFTFGLSMLLTGLMYFLINDVAFVWIYPLSLLLYTAGVFVDKLPLRLPLKLVGLLGAIVLNLFFVFTLDPLIEYDGFSFPNPLLYNAALLILAGGIYYKKRRDSLLDLSLFLPFFYMGIDVLYLVLLFIYSIGILLLGYQEEDREKVNLGTLLFLISTLSAYIHLAWDFMPKSLFFLIGGLMLFALSWYLEKRRRRVVHRSGGTQK